MHLSGTPLAAALYALHAAQSVSGLPGPIRGEDSPLEKRQFFPVRWIKHLSCVNTVCIFQIRH